LKLDMASEHDSNRKPRLFINYRSEDTGATASRLYEALTREFQPDQVFLDHQRIEGGANWPSCLQREAALATVMFVLIGDRWLTIQDAETGERRLNNPQDWVRQEIETALNTDTEVVPIFVEGASPPTKRVLQTVPSIDRLADLHGLPLRRMDWKADSARLVDWLLNAGLTRGLPARPGTPNDPRIELVLDRLLPYRDVQNGRPVIYGTVTLSDGSTAFGEGVRVQLTLENHSSVDVVVSLVDVAIEDYDPHPIERFEYCALQTSGTHLEVPGSTRIDPIELTGLEGAGDSIPVTRGRLFLRAETSAETHHTFNFSLVARASGIWRIRVKAEFLETVGSSHRWTAHSDVFRIVKS
jgi:hypothetical protein